MTGANLLPYRRSFFTNSLSLLLLVPLALACCACQKKKASKEIDPEQRIENYGNLSGLKKTQNQDLLDEVARLETEKATPALLSPEYAREKSATPDKAKMQPDWTELLPPRLVEDVDEAKKTFPRFGFNFNPVTLEGARKFVHRHRKLRRNAKSLLLQSGYHFNMDHFHGFQREDTFRELVILLCYIEFFAAADELEKEQLGGAIGPILTAMQYITLLGQEKNIVTRCEAATLRMGVFVATEAIVQSPGVSQEDLKRLAAGYCEMLAKWPSDSDAWIGERAEGLYFYEWVRDGQVLSILSEEELKNFSKDKKVFEMGDAITGNVDTDQLFYLKTMRKLIKECHEKPFFQRGEFLMDIRRELDELHNTPKYPIFAAKILMVDMEEQQLEVACDRAQTEAWALALTTASGMPVPDFKINPANGEAYAIINTPTNVVVKDGLSGSQPITVPIPNASATPDPAADR